MQVQYNTNTILNLIFKMVAISQITGKCKLGGFSLRQSHNILLYARMGICMVQINKCMIAS